MAGRKRKHPDPTPGGCPTPSPDPTGGQSGGPQKRPRHPLETLLYPQQCDGPTVHAADVGAAGARTGPQPVGQPAVRIIDIPRLVPTCL